VLLFYRADAGRNKHRNEATRLNLCHLVTKTAEQMRDTVPIQQDDEAV